MFAFCSKNTAENSRCRNPTPINFEPTNRCSEERSQPRSSEVFAQCAGGHQLLSYRWDGDVPHKNKRAI